MRSALTLGCAIFAFGVMFGIAVTQSRKSIQHTDHCERIAGSMPLFGDCN
jgi:hypothetical protein